jgi:hypothetical protein
MSARQVLHQTLATATLLILASAISAGPMGAQQEATIAGLQVTGTRAEATLTWNPVAGALSYSVKRWKQNDRNCCNNSVDGLTQPKWSDRGTAGGGFPGPGIYVFKVVAHLKGSRASALTTWTLQDAAAPATAMTLAPVGIVAMAPAAMPSPTTSPAAQPPALLPGAPVTALWVPGTARAPAALAPVAAAAPPAAPAWPPASASATARFTGFNPAVHGFRFVNNFKNSFIGPPFSVYTGGLCGGMSYAVLDYYNAGRSIPPQDYRPANNTALQSYLYGRQVTSLMQNLDKWAETTVNPFGSRSLEFFNWGINERLRELKSFIDRGVPVPLGLKGTGGGIDHDHQVLAIGYDMGRYQGDLGAYKTDVKIYLLDPNFPTRTVTLVPIPDSLVYHELEYPDHHWQTYFVDGKYGSMTPPAIAAPTYPNDGLAHELLLEIETGQDDMRGGGDHVDLTLKLADNTTQFYPNISQNGIFLAGYMETVQVILSQPVPVASLKALQINTNPTADSWALQSFQAYAVGGGFKQTLLSSRTGPHIFVGSSIPMLVDVR